MYLVFIIFLYEITQMFLKSAPKKNYMLNIFILFIQTALQSVSSDFCFSQCFELP